MKKHILCISVLCLFIGFVFASPKQAYQPTSIEPSIYGCIVSGKSPMGIYATTTGNPPTLQNLKTLQGFTPTAGVFANGNYYLLSKMERNGIVAMCTMDKYDTKTWQVTGSGFPGNDIVPTSLTYNTKDSKTYGCFPNKNNGFDFCSFDLNSCQKTVIATLTQQFVALFADNKGMIYGIGLDGNLYSFNLETGVPNQIGVTGIIPSKDAQDACFDEESGNSYWFARTATESALYTLDTTSGKATKVTDFENPQISWCGVFVQPKQKALKPSFITNMKTEFTKNSLNGYFSFTLPDKAETGEPLSGSMSYTVLLDDTKLKTGEDNAGAEVTIPVTIEKEGSHKFSVYASLNGLDGQISYIEKFIGQDIPKAPANFKASLKPNTNHVDITWDAVTEGVNLGYINIESIRYTLIRQPDHKILGSDLTITSFTDESINSMNNYYYMLTVTDGSKTSETVSSDTLLVGENIGILPPYKYSFLDGNGFGFFTTIDANKDGNTWTHNEHNVYYNTSVEKDADDWLVSPQLKLEKGKNYNLSMTLLTSDFSKTEKFEIKYGKEANADAMIHSICPIKEISTNHTVSEWICPEENGIYYIGIHALSENAQGALGIMNFNISAGISPESPSTATNITITAGEKGELLSRIEFICPTTNFENKVLTELTKVEVSNLTTGATIVSQTDIQSGQKISTTDLNPKAGMNEYAITCFNSAGVGITAIKQCWIGHDSPASPSKATWIQKGNQVVISWEAPTTGKHGGYINPEKTTYSIYNSELEIEIQSGLKECSYTYTPEISTLQTSLKYQIYATNEYGTSLPANTNYSAFGVGYECPFKESFCNQKLQSLPWIILPVSGRNIWQLTSEITSPTIKPQDKDKGMIAYNAANPGISRLESPIINIANCKRPALKLWYYMMDKSTEFRIKVSNDCGITWEEIAILPQEHINQWVMSTIDLANCKNFEHLQIGLEAANTQSGYPLFVDNITIDNNWNYDLAITSMDIPKQTTAGSLLKGLAHIVNNGSTLIEQFQLECYADQELIATYEGSQLEADQLKAFEFEIPISINHSENMEITCKVVYQNDENQENNILKETASISISKYPQPTALKAETNANNHIMLTWEAPSTVFTPERTDDLESYEAWTIGGIDVVEDKESGQMIVTKDHGNIGDYTLIDNDHLPTQYIMGAWGKPIPHLGDGMVCQLLDIELYDNSQSSIMAAHSGNKTLCFWTSPQNDDYFILPELASTNKYISFWAKSLSSRYGLESFDILISTTGKEIEDFTLLTTITDVPTGYKTDPEAGYTFYEFDLPEETKYVALHYNSKDVLALLVDDITCTPASNKQNLSLEGFNIYRNEIQINREPVKETHFTDLPLNSDLYNYNVTAVFKEGESRFSNTAEVAFTSKINQTPLANPIIYTEKNTIIIHGMEGETIAVYSIDGRLIKQFTAQSSSRVYLPEGTYLIKTKLLTQKVVL